MEKLKIKLTVSVFGDPKATPRVKATRVGSGLRIYTPATADVWKRKIRAEVERALSDLERFGMDGVGRLPVAGIPFRCYAVFRMPRPGNHYRTGRFSGRLKPRFVDIPHTAKPDLDNLLKAVWDSLGHFGGEYPILYADDSQISQVFAEKRYTWEDEQPGLSLSFATLNEDDRDDE